MFNLVFVQWEFILKYYVKGILQGYYVYYSQEDMKYFVIKNEMIVNGFVMYVILDSMKLLMRYYVWIMGFIKKGVGFNSEKGFVFIF